MNYKLKYIQALLMIAMLFSSCKKEEYNIGDLNTPANLAITANIAGLSITSPYGDSTGLVNFIVTADNALTYHFDFGDGSRVENVASGTVTHKFARVGTFPYTVTVTAYGTGGTASTLSKMITVSYKYELSPGIITYLTNDASKVWITDKAAPGHFGVGPNSTFGPDWYAAAPDTREPCAYDDEISFTKVSANNLSISVDNKGQSFMIGAATGFYGASGGDACNNLNTGGTKSLSFSEAGSASTTAVSTRVEFTVPGNGIVNFGTGGTAYEIIAVSANSLFLRNIGSDGNAWYQKLKPL